MSILNTLKGAVTLSVKLQMAYLNVEMIVRMMRRKMVTSSQWDAMPRKLLLALLP